MSTEVPRIMGIGAHPDDLELLCAGTLAAYRARGQEVTMCHIASGNLGATAGHPVQIADRRAAEASAGAAVIGATHISLGFDDGRVDASSELQKRALVDAIRRARPDVIITHTPDDYMEDHNQASRLAFAASFLATLPLYDSPYDHLESVPALIYMDSLSGLGFEPTEFVDISTHLDTKLEMMRAHTSQLDWLDDHDGMNALDQITTVAAFRGLQSGVKYAEAFRPCLSHLRARTSRLLP